jgi:hypothetical protein
MEIFTKNSAKCTVFQSTICNKFSSLMCATYNMVGFICFNEELSLLPKNPTEAKLQAVSTQGESTEPTKGVMKHTYKVVLYNYCLMQYFCILSYQLVGSVNFSMNTSYGRYGLLIIWLVFVALMKNFCCCQRIQQRQSYKLRVHRVNPQSPLKV